MGTGIHKKHRIRLFLLLLFILILILFFYYNKIDKITIQGCEFYSEEELKEKMIKGFIDNNSILLYLKARYIGMEDIPYIEKVTVKRVNNHEVSIRIYEKSLVACVKYMGEYLYFDKDGVILDVSSETVEGVPCISGLSFSTFTVYEQLKVEETEIFKVILDLSQIIRRYKLKIDKIHFNSKNEVTLTSGKIKVYLGKRDFYDEPLAALSEILPTAADKNLKGSIDMENYVFGDKVIFRSQ